MADLISRQAAIDAVRKLYILEPRINNDYAYDMALDQTDAVLKALPSADAVEVVRCKDCKHYVSRESVCKLHSNNYEPPVSMDDDDYCSYGERKDE